MEKFLSSFMYSFMGVFVAMDILGLTPIYLAITKHTDKEKVRKILKQALLVAGFVALAFVFLGRYIFKVMGIEPYDFQIAGGVVLLVISILELVQGKKNEPTNVSHFSGVVPLAVPMITGPALITIIILQVGIYGYAVVCASLFANFFIAWLALSQSRYIFKMIGEEGAEVVSKIAVLFMTAFAFAMIRLGFLQVIKDVK